MRSFFAILLKTLLYTVLVVLLVAGIVVVSLQIPAVQTELVRYAAKRVSEKLLFPVDIQRIDIKFSFPNVWVNSLTLEEVTIRNRDLKPMISVGRLEVGLALEKLINNSATDIHLDEVLLYQPRVALVKDAKTGNLNIDDFVERINEMTRDTTKPSVANQNIPFTIGKATLIDGTFTYNDMRKSTMGGRLFDYNHFKVSGISANLNSFLLLGDTIAVNIGRMKGFEKQGNLRIHRLDTKFLYCAKEMRLDSLFARINGSTVRNKLVFSYDNFSAFNEFNDEVVMRANLRNSVVRAQDLAPFTSYFNDNFDVARASGDYVGRIKNFKVTNADIRFGPNHRSRLVGDLAFKGLPDSDENTIVDFRFKPSQVNLADLRPYYSDPDFDRIMAKLGTLDFAATYAGRFIDFKTVGTFKTKIGSVSGDLALHLNGDQGTTYSGNLKLTDVDAGSLIDQSDLQRIDGQGKFEGRGLTIKDGSLDLNAQFTRVGFRNYKYRNIAVHGNLQQSFFRGQVSAKDTNLTFSLNGEFDLRGAKNLFDVRGTVQQANLLATNLLDDSLVVRSDLDVQLVGNTVNELVGNARLLNTYLTYGKRNLILDTLFFASSVTGNERTISVNSDYLDANLKGNFQLTHVADDLNRIAKEYRLNFAGNAAGMAAYYQEKLRKPVPVVPYNIDYSFLLKNAQPLLTLIYPSLYASPNTKLEGRFGVDQSSLLTLTGTIDTLKFDTYNFYKSTVDLNTSKFVNSPDVLASLIIGSKQQQFGSLAATENLQAEASWDVNHIDFTTSLQQQKSSNRADLNGSLTFKGDAIDIELEQSKFRLLDSIWTISPENLIRIVGPEITVRNLAVSNQNQFISISGRASQDSLQTLDVEARNFLLATLNPVLETKISGVANGKVAIRGLYGLPLLDGNMTIDSLKYNDFLIGNVVNRSTLDQSNRINLDTRIRRLDRELLAITGVYTPGASASNPLDLKAVLEGTDLRILEPFVKDIATNLGGTATGVVTIKGKVSSPVLGGTVDITNGRLTLDYLKADIGFSDKVYFGASEIVAKNMVLTDLNGGRATLRGGVFHDGFKYFTVDLNIVDMKNFKILNTTLKDNDQFYGTAVASGRASIDGPFDNLNIRANVTSNRGTKIYIPLDQATTVSKEEVIRFINVSPAHRDSVAQTNEPVVDLSGIRMDFNLSITPDAYCEIQLDRQTGDIIKAYGTGQLAMKIDTKGDFTMTGAYEIQQGEYTFTFENVINKRFQMLPNSRITWTGDPYEAMVDVKTAYTQYASLAPILQYYSSSSTNNPDRTRRYPVDLLINLNGRLLAPDISYDLKVKEYPQQPDFRQAVAAFESRLKSNDQELGRQVSSILLFNQLAPGEGLGLIDPASSAGNNMVGSGLTNSLSELLSNQISRLASTLDKNLDVGVSLNGLDQNLVNNLQVRLSYRFNDRFRISRDGGFTYGQNQTSVASLLGEWTLEYWLSPDGQLRLKMYNRNQNQLGTINATTYGTLTTGGGMSIQYTRSFNRLFGPAAVPPRPGIQPQPTPIERPANTIPAPVSETSALQEKDDFQL
ncbi:translocation/assembly module TamB domain-containing protein [Larkinella terrae]|uniref:Translocation/assembly module TamB n=1 Tax=Larkinella terrae TaxID=2025311 RepID=A0A7K0EJW2_9BACT|nr:translocation/assembly module TamB domain-containing protein [Larkinella terrae]MRS61728.1 translocation/assembly module TamB [Larkinella terrae]